MNSNKTASERVIEAIDNGKLPGKTDYIKQLEECGLLNNEAQRIEVEAYIDSHPDLFDVTK